MDVTILYVFSPGLTVLQKSQDDGRHAYPSLLECHVVVAGRPSF